MRSAPWSAARVSCCASRVMWTLSSASKPLNTEDVLQRETAQALVLLVAEARGGRCVLRKLALAQELEELLVVRHLPVVAQCRTL